MDSLENLYLDKLEIEYKEELFDLLLENLKYVHLKIKKNQKNKEKLERLLKILDSAIEKLYFKIYNFKTENYLVNLSKKHYQRYILKIINVYLTYEPKNTKLKELKQEIINDFIKDEKSEIEDRIPYTSQLNELRITFDTNYIEYLIKSRFLPKEEWIKSIYFLEAIKLIEPDWTLNSKKLKDIIFEVEKHFENFSIDYCEEFNLEKGSFVLIDANIFINILKNHDSNFFCDLNIFLNKTSKENKVFLLQDVLDEIEENMGIYLEYLKNQKENNESVFENIKTKISNKMESFKQDYFVDFVLKDKDKNLNKVKQFYYKYILILRNIFEYKTKDLKISKKLRKLAQREFFLPEHSDLMLLVQAIEIKERFEKEVYIFSNDKDLYLFNKEIYDKFGIKVIRI